MKQQSLQPQRKTDIHNLNKAIHILKSISPQPITIQLPEPTFSTLKQQLAPTSQHNNHFHYMGITIAKP